MVILKILSGAWLLLMAGVAHLLTVGIPVLVGIPLVGVLIAFFLGFTTVTAVIVLIGVFDI